MRRRPTSLSSWAAAAVLATVAALSGCSADADDAAAAGGSSGPVSSSTAEQLAVAAQVPQANTVVPGTSADALAAGVSSVLFTSADRVLVAGADDAPAQATVAEGAARLGVPALVTGEACAQEAQRLGAAVVPVGTQAEQWAADQGMLVADDAADLLADTSADTSAGPSTSTDIGTDVRTDTGSQRPTAVLLVSDPGASTLAGATARAAGAQVVELPGADPRADGDLVTQLGTNPQVPVVAAGDAFGPAERLDTRLATVRTGVQVPGPDGLGGQLPLAGRRLVALYGHPGTPSLGVLGEQDTAATITRARDVAQAYAGLDALAPAPALEVIATTASSSAGGDGDYSSETPVEDLRPLVDAALDDGVQVVLDLQPGRDTFPDQARQYEELLALPGVGLALDPEWRLAPGQVHLDQIGSVSVDEVNETAAWLADLTRDRQLPQKVFLVHQFRTSMVKDRARLDTGRDELAYVIHADGAGAPAEKRATYAALTADAPDGVVWGWKNFYDEDSPVLTPAETVTQAPVPVFVSYQ